jgi:hypothetical protein
MEETTGGQALEIYDEGADNGGPRQWRPKTMGPKTMAAQVAGYDAKDHMLKG